MPAFWSKPDHWLLLMTAGYTAPSGSFPICGVTVLEPSSLRALGSSFPSPCPFLSLHLIAAAGEPTAAGSQRGRSGAVGSHWEAGAGDDPTVLATKSSRTATVIGSREALFTCHLSSGLLQSLSSHMILAATL